VQLLGPLPASELFVGLRCPAPQFREPVKGEKVMKQLSFAIVIMLFASPALAWDGYDYESGNYVEIEKGNLVRPGEEIEYYDYGTGEYRYGDVGVHFVFVDRLNLPKRLDESC
jgi:hypothetical protein